MRTFKAFNNPEIFITGSFEPSFAASKGELVNFKNDLNDFCRIINYVRQDQRWIAVINPSSLLKNMLNAVELDTRQIIMVYSNDRSNNIDTICRALACGNCAAVIGKHDDVSLQQYQKIYDACITGNSIAYIIGQSEWKTQGEVYSSPVSTMSCSHSLFVQSAELSFENKPTALQVNNDLNVKSSDMPNIIDFKSRKQELQSSFDF
ncbi:MAG: hypothetical protein D6B28_04650 [Gammaproteobacteria bacterium]|nr:MAG: hypothetical protein D6B28_04650 [Gammaproteobacteria bacterium]